MFKNLMISALALLLAVCACFAQTTTGAITGTVTDASGAAVPNVRVTVTNIATNVAIVSQSNDAGVYTLPFLTIGNYTISAEAQGFKRIALGPFPLEVNQIARVNLRLEVARPPSRSKCGPSLQCCKPRLPRPGPC